MKYLILFLFLLIFVQDGLSVMSDKQLAATKKLVRNTCLGKSQVEADKVDGMHKGDFDMGDKTLGMYAHCVLMTYKLMKKDNSFDWEAGLAVIKANAPPAIALTAGPAFKKCKDAVKSNDKKYKAALEIMKCVYDADPPNYFLP